MDSPLHLFHDKRHPKEMNSPEVETFLTHLSTQEHVAASTQNQALSALLFLYKNVLHQPLPESIAARLQLKVHIVDEDEVLPTIAHIVLPGKQRASL